MELKYIMTAALLVFVTLWLLSANDNKTKVQYNKHQVLISLLHDTSSVLREDNIPHWLNYRTLRGWRQAGDFLEEDYNVDLGVLAEDKEKILHTLVNKLPRQKYTIVDERSFGIQVVHTATGLSLELTQYTADLEPKNPSDWLKIMYHQETTKLKPNWIFPVRGELMQGFKVPIPAQPDILLNNWYGTH